MKCHHAPLLLTAVENHCMIWDNRIKLHFGGIKLKKKIIIIVSCVVVLSTVATALYFLLCKTGNPEQDLSSTLSAMVAGEVNENTYILSATGNKMTRFNNGEIAQSIISSIRYEIKDIKKENGETKAIIHMIVPNAQNILQKVSNESNFKTPEKLLQSFSDKIKTSNDTKEYDVTVTLALMDKHWHLISDYEFNNAITGGILELYKNNEIAALKEMQDKEGESL